MTRTTAVTPDLDELRRVAGWAHAPSPWTADSFETECGLGRYDAYQVFDAEGREILDTGNCHYIAGELKEEHGDDESGGRLWDEAARRNTRHIAAWCPANALAVLDLVADLRDRLAKAEAERDAMREANRSLLEKAATIADPPLMHRKGKIGLWRRRRAEIAAAIRAAALVAGEEISLNTGSANELGPAGRSEEITSGDALVAGQEADR